LKLGDPYAAERCDLLVEVRELFGDQPATLGFADTAKGLRIEVSGL
jgi:hypothetical protein